MDKEFVKPEPDTPEWLRTTETIARLKDLPIPLDERAMWVTLTLIHHRRRARNVVTQWEVDQDSVVEEGLRMLKRHTDILRWMLEVDAADTDPEPPPEGNLPLTAFITPEDVESYARALNEPDKLRADLVEKFSKFVDWYAARH